MDVNFGVTKKFQWVGKQDELYFLFPLTEPLLAHPSYLCVLGGWCIRAAALQGGLPVLSQWKAQQEPGGQGEDRVAMHMPLSAGVRDWALSYIFRWPPCGAALSPVLAPRVRGSTPALAKLEGTAILLVSFPTPGPSFQNSPFISLSSMSQVCCPFLDRILKEGSQNFHSMLSVDTTRDSEFFSLHRLPLA